MSARIGPFRLVACTLLALGGATLSARAQGPIAATLDPSSTVQFRVTLVGRSGTWAVAPMTATVDVGAPAAAGAGPVVVRNLHLGAPFLNLLVAVQGASPVTVAVSQIAVSAAPGAGASLPVQSGYAGELDFAGAGISCSASGSANYYASGLACNTLIAGGAPCQGTFDLSAAGPNTSAFIDLGAITPGSPRTFTLHFYASFPFAAGTTWGTLDAMATLRGTLPQAPACPADYNGANGLTVQDIFDFLAGWFAANPAADFNHTGGLSVQDIFDFLAAWFAGCP